MSKRSWNNGTRELEKIAGAVIFNEGANTFGSAMRDLARISGEQEADKLYGAIHAEVQGGKSVEEVLKDMNYPEDRHKVMAISYKNWLASKSEDAEGESLADQFHRFAYLVSALEQGMTEYDEKEISSDILRNTLNELDAKLGTLGGEPEL